MRLKPLIGAVIAAGMLALAAWGSVTLYRAANTATAAPVPFTKVKRGDVTFAVYARGELQGGNSIMLQAPMVGGAQLAITELRGSGELVKKDDVVVQFDTTDQVYKLKEARGGSCRSRAEGGSGAGPDGRERGRRPLRTDQSSRRPEASGAGGAQESAGGRDPGQGNRPGSAVGAGHGGAARTRSGQSQGEFARQREDPGGAARQSQSSGGNRAAEYRDA